MAVSIKTQQAARLILNQILEDIHRMRSEGVLDEIETHKLEVVRSSQFSYPVVVVVVVGVVTACMVVCGR